MSSCSVLQSEEAKITVAAPLRRRLRIVLLSPPGDLGQIVASSLAALHSRTLLICDARSSIRLSRSIERALLVQKDVFHEPELVAQAIEREHAHEKIDAVMASSVEGLAMLSELRSRISPPVYPMADAQTLALLNDKWRFAGLCADCEVATPKTLFYETASAADLDQIADEIGFPLVMKPISASGGEGVKVIDDASELARRLRQLDEHFNKGVLIQTFIRGDDLGLSVFAIEGEIRNWTTFQCDAFWSSRFRDIPKLLEAGQRLVTKTKFTGVANFDARQDPETGDITFFECNPRFFRRVAAARNCGLDFVAAGLAALGLAEPPPRCLIEGAHLSGRDLMSRAGAALLLSHKYPLRAAMPDLVDFLRDPAPPLAALCKAGVTSITQAAPLLRAKASG